MSRRRDRKGLQVGRGERYALLPREIVESIAYHVLPDWARSVLIALLCQYHGHNNGCIALTYAQAKSLGVSPQWKLYAGLRLLEETGLIVCTRRGRLQGGKAMPSFYAITWRGIDDPKEGIIYDGGMGACPIPSHTWGKWARPANWSEQVRNIADRAHGKTKKAPYNRKTADTPQGVTAAHPRGSGKRKSRSPQGVAETTNPAHPVGVTSKTSAVGAVRMCRS